VRVRVVFLSVLAAACAALAAEPPRLEVFVPDVTVRVGDRVAGRVAARGGEDLMWGGLQVDEQDGTSWVVLQGPSEVAGSQPPTWEFVLAPMEVGEIALPTFRVTVRDRDGRTREITTIGNRTITVASVLPAGDEVEPTPLRDPVGVSGFPWEWALPAALPLLALAAALTWWGTRRRRAAAASAPPPAPIDELETVLATLETRVGREPAEGVCDRLAVALRHYLERRCGEPAEEMTSFELRLLARKLGWPQAVQRGVQDVMGTADRVRFGRYPAEDTQLRHAIIEARHTAAALEEHLRPTPEEDAVAEAAG